MVYRDEGGMIYDEEIEPVFEPGILGDSPNQMEVVKICLETHIPPIYG